VPWSHKEWRYNSTIISTLNGASVQLHAFDRFTPKEIAASVKGCVKPRVDLNYMEKRNILPFSGNEPQPSSRSSSLSWLLLLSSSSFFIFFIFIVVDSFSILRVNSVMLNCWYVLWIIALSKSWDEERLDATFILLCLPCSLYYFQNTVMCSLLLTCLCRYFISVQVLCRRGGKEMQCFIISKFVLT
jgi:hypothetical protein